jgi:3-dehydroquinate dehydratase-2
MLLKENYYLKTIYVIHGPNLNLLGEREPGTYGNVTLTEINKKLISLGQALGFEVATFQSNHEGELIDALHAIRTTASGIIINPGGFTHTSVALRDAISSINIPVIEVHLSNVYKREEFRHTSLISPVCAGKIVGFGWRSYILAMYAFSDNEAINSLEK